MPFLTALVVFVVLNVLLIGFVLWLAPRRGFWNQPAARLRSPSRGVRRALYAFGALHVLVGLTVASGMPGSRIGIVVVSCLAGLFYVACAECIRIAGSVLRRQDDVAAATGD